MKSFTISFLIIYSLLNMALSSQSQNIFAYVNGDTVTLWETGANRNCGAIYTMEINLSDHHIDWYQIDTGFVVNCMCTFDLSVTYGPLEPGSYNVNVYYNESYSPSDTIFEGTTSFTIGTDRCEVTSGIISQYQSDCYSGIGIVDPNDAERNNFKMYPVPVRDGELIHIEAFPIRGKAILEIFTLTGKLVYSKQYDRNQPIHDRFMKDEIFPVPGLYLARLRTGDQVYIRKITVL